MPANETDPDLIPDEDGNYPVNMGMLAYSHDARGFGTCAVISKDTPPYLKYMARLDWNKTYFMIHPQHKNPRFYLPAEAEQQIQLIDYSPGAEKMLRAKGFEKLLYNKYPPISYTAFYVDNTDAEQVSLEPVASGMDIREVISKLWERGSKGQFTRDVELFAECENPAHLLLVLKIPVKLKGFELQRMLWNARDIEIDRVKRIIKGRERHSKWEVKREAEKKKISARIDAYWDGREKLRDDRAKARGFASHKDLIANTRRIMEAERNRK